MVNLNTGVKVAALLQLTQTETRGSLLPLCCKSGARTRAHSESFAKPAQHLLWISHAVLWSAMRLRIALYERGQHKWRTVQTTRNAIRQGNTRNGCLLDTRRSENYIRAA